MKKTLVTLAIGLVAVGAFAQGTINFQNNTTVAPIRLADNTLAPVGGNVRVALYYSTEAVAPMAGTELVMGATTMLNPTLAGWTQTTPTGADIISPSVGRFLGGTQTAATAVPGSQIWALVVGWTGPAVYADWTSAYTAWSSGVAGVQIMQGTAFRQGTGNPTITPAVSPVVLALGANGFQGLTLSTFVNPVPEPSTFALAGLGLAGLLIFRRRS